jgi:hypothetical protein
MFASLLSNILKCIFFFFFLQHIIICISDYCIRYYRGSIVTCAEKALIKYAKSFELKKTVGQTYLSNLKTKKLYKTHLGSSTFSKYINDLHFQPFMKLK